MTKNKVSSLSRRAFGAGAAAAAIATPSILRAQAVEIEYWQYFFKERVEAMDELIKQFQAANPGIRVKHTHFPYAQYRTKTAAAVPAGEGADGDAALLRLDARICEGEADPAAPRRHVQAVGRRPRLFRGRADDEDQRRLLGAADAVRSLGMFYNKRLFKEANIGETPAATLDDYVKHALATAKRDGGGNLTQAGATIGIPSQDYHWWRES